jgi:hypothetical protein
VQAFLNVRPLGRHVREAAHVGERRLDRLQVDLERVQQHGQHGEVAQAADQVEDPLLTQFGQDDGERLVGDEVVLEDLDGELVDDLLVRLGEPRLPAFRQRGQAVPADPKAGCLADVRVPGVLRVEVPGRDEQAQLAQPRVQCGLEPAVRAERLDLLAQFGTAQPDREQPARCLRT